MAETFAPLAECALFSLLVNSQKLDAMSGTLPLANHATWQDYAAIVAANLASFLGGEWLFKNVAWLKKLITIES